MLINVECDNEVLCKEKLDLNDNLTTIRQKLKNINIKIFLDDEGQSIEKEHEKYFTLKEVISGNILKIKNCSQTIKIFLNKNYICIKYFSIDVNLEYIRENLKNIIKDDYFFLDDDSNKIDKEDEKDFIIKNILINDSIYLKSENKRNIKINYDFSKYDIIKKDNDLIIYKYNKNKSISDNDNEFFNHHYYDKFEENEKDIARVILFIGKTGHGKTLAINALFNIIKKIKLEDKFRFILIEETQKQIGKTITKGINLYYLRDYNNYPIILIDTQGFEHTGGLQFDEKLSSNLSYSLYKRINHINSICFVVNSTESYIKKEILYKFNIDINDNLIFLATFVNKDIMKNGPLFIKKNEEDYDFRYLDKIKKEDIKYLYSSDNFSIFDNDIDQLTKYSFKQLKELYETTKKLNPKILIENWSDIIKYSLEPKISYNNLSVILQDIIVEYGNIYERVNKLNEIDNKINIIESEIINEENKIKNLNEEKANNILIKLNDYLENNIKFLNSQKIVQIEKILQLNEKQKNICCNICKQNCCEEFIYDNICSKCGHIKESHENNYKHYIFVKKDILFNNDQNNLEEKNICANNINELMDKLNKNKLQIDLKKINIKEEKIKLKKLINQNEILISYILIKEEKLNNENKIGCFGCCGNNKRELKIKLEHYLYYLNEVIKEVGYDETKQKILIEKIIKNVNNFKKYYEKSLDKLLNIPEKVLFKKYKMNKLYDLIINN